MFTNCKSQYTQYAADNELVYHIKLLQPFHSRILMFFSGNDNIYIISNNGSHQLALYLEDFEHQYRYANYSTFSIGNEQEGYVLHFSGYHGNAGNLPFHSPFMYVPVLNSSL